jgi:hypothetical protein
MPSSEPEESDIQIIIQQLLKYGQCTKKFS